MATAIIGKDGASMARQIVVAEIEIIAGRIVISFPLEVRQEIVIHTPQLTRKEKEVIDLLQQGYSTKQVAARCGVQPRTVKYHIGQIYKKFRVTDRAELLALVGIKPKGSGV
jgi:DNA-binding CsgD family transcriptional regulator